MKKALLSTLLLMPAFATAQTTPAMNQAQMQQMMQQMQGMQSCLQNIDRNDMRNLEQRGRAMQTEIKGLCSRGQRDKAQSAAMNYALKMANDPAVQAMKKCGEQMSKFLPDMPQDAFPSREELHNRHICDEL